MDKRNAYSNIPPSIEEKNGLNLHNAPNNPICIIKNHIYKYFTSLPNSNFKCFDNLNPFVSTIDNFDLLRIPTNHPSRSKSDTYYVNEDMVLRTHTSAHQNELLAQGETSFLVTGDVYRKDEIDRCHYNIFHQMEVVCLVEDDQDPQDELYKVLNGLVNHLFPNSKYKILGDYFPFTEPSFQIEVDYDGKDIEILGCGIIHKDILNRHNIKKKGYAIGFGVERLAMIFFKIPDIRLFWTKDSRVLDQFKEGQITEYKPVPYLECITKDISFWLKDEDVLQLEKKEGSLENEFVWTKFNDFNEIVRNLYGDDVESVQLFDKFYHKKMAKHSHTFRLKFTPCVDTLNPADFTKQTNDRMKQLEANLSSIVYAIR